MIKIQNIKIQKNAEYSRLNAEVIIDNKLTNMYYQVEIKHAKYLCDSKSDGFVVALLPLAMLKGEDIYIEAPISKKLLHGLVNILIPALTKMNSKLSTINIIGKTSNETFNDGCGSATGISLGVDSLFTIQNLKEDLRFLTFFDSLKNGEDYYSKIKEFNEIIEEPKKVSELLNKDFIAVFSNNLIFLEDFAYEQIHTFSNLSNALILQRCFEVYYYASAYPENVIKYHFSDSANYDSLTQGALQTESFKMISYSAGCNRVEKTESISNYDISKKHLVVCLVKKTDRNTKEINCSKCAKCIRTMVTLDALNKLEGYTDVFDVDLYHKKRKYYIADVVYKSRVNKNVLANEIYNLFKIKGVKISMFSWFLVLKIGFKNQTNKIKRRFK